MLWDCFWDQNNMIGGRYYSQYAKDLLIGITVSLPPMTSPPPPPPTVRFARAASGKQLLVGYWGQNAAGPKRGPANYERRLKWFCENSKYDVLILAFMDILFNGDADTDGLPGLNFAYHCDTIVDQAHPNLLRCPEIEADIKVCQRLGKPILLSMGGATGDGTLGSPARARKLAHNIWDLFLGSKDTNFAALRSFGSAVLDGIDLDIEGGRSNYYPNFVRELRMLMDSDPSKRYYITGAPECPYPDHFLGPGAGTGLGEAGQYFDHLYIRFYNNYCHTGAGQWFTKTLQQWLDFARNRKPKGPLIFIGLPASTGGSSGAQYYRPPNELAKMYKLVRNKTGIGGIMLWDCSWDQNNVIGGRYYSQYAKDLLIGITVSLPPMTSPPPPPPTGSVDCKRIADGLYPDPADCSKYFRCAQGVMYNLSCPPGLHFNTKSLHCDWPANVNCN